MSACFYFMFSSGETWKAEHEPDLFPSRPPTRCSSSESLGLNNRISTNLKCDIAERGKTLGLGRCLYEFYRAPITKFWGNVVSNNA